MVRERSSTQEIARRLCSSCQQICLSYQCHCSGRIRRRWCGRTAERTKRRGKGRHHGPLSRIADVVRPTPLLPSSTGAENWWQPTLPLSHTAPVDTWKVVPSSPSTTSSGDSSSSMWATIGLNELQLPSPTPSYSQPYTTAAHSPTQYYSSSTSSAPIPQLPLPSMMQQQCSTSAGYGGFGWENYQSFALPYAM